MRVLQIVNSPEPGGVLSLSDSIASGLARHGIAVETAFITPGAAMPALGKVAGALAMARRIATADHDAIIAYQGAGAITLALAGPVSRAAVRIVHQTTVPSATGRLVRLADRIIGGLGLYPANVVNTVFTRSQFDAYPARYRDRLVLIEHGVDAPVVTQPRAETLRSHGLPLDRPILLNTGRLVEQKNQAVTIRSLRDVPDAHLVIAGGGDCGDAYRTLAAECGVADRLHLLGALPFDRTVELYGAADLFVFPSRHETFGISGVEAVMLGLPTIVSDIPVFREVLSIAGRSAVDFVDPDDADAWARAIRRRLSDPAGGHDLAAFATAMREKYAQQRMIDGYLALLGAGST